MAANGRIGPVQLCSCDAEGRLHLEPSASAFLGRLRQPIGVLSLVGPSRTGKSSLLNDLLGKNYPAVFKTSAAVSACTKGLWATAIPAPVWCSELAGAAGTLLLLDTEGLGAPDAPAHDPQLFALACILSSVVGYNSFGLVEEISIARLGRLCSIASRVLRHTADTTDGTTAGCAGGSGSRSLGLAASAQPALLWLLRDFSHGILGEEGEEGASADAYLEDALRPRADGRRLTVSSADQSRAMLCSCFEVRACATLPQPLADMLNEERDALSDGRRTPQWVEGVAALRARLSQLLKPRMLAGGAIDGASLASLLARGVEMLSSPDAQTGTMDELSRGILRTQSERARRLAISAYSVALHKAAPGESLPLGRRRIDEAHRGARAAAVEVYSDVAPFGRVGRRPHGEESRKGALVHGGGVATAGEDGDSDGGGDDDDADAEGDWSTREKAAAVARDPDWPLAEVEMCAVLEDLRSRDAVSANARCEEALAATGEALATSFAASAQQHESSRRSGSLDPSDAIELAVCEVEELIRPHLLCLIDPVEQRRRGIQDGGGGGGGGVSGAADEYEVTWRTVGSALPLLLRRATHAATRLGSAISGRLAECASEATRVELEHAHKLLRTARADAVVSREAIAALEVDVRARAVGDRLLIEELSELELHYASWHDPSGLVESLHQDVERAHRKGRAAAARLESCETQMDGLHRRFATSVSPPLLPSVDLEHGSPGGSSLPAGALVGGVAERSGIAAPSKLGARAADALPRERAVLACGLNFSTACSADGRLFVWGSGGKGQLGVASPPGRSSIMRTLAPSAAPPPSAFAPLPGTDSSSSTYPIPSAFATPAQRRRSQQQQHSLQNPREDRPTALRGTASSSAANEGGGLGGGVFGEPGTLDAPLPREVVVVGLTVPASTSADSPVSRGSGGGGGPVGGGGGGGRGGAGSVVAAGGEAGGVVTLAAAAEHCLATDASGKVWSWGQGRHGELGNGSTGLSGTPRLVKALSSKRVVSIAAGGRHCAAVTFAGELYTWGDGRMGQLGHGDTQPRHAPSPVVPLRGRHLASVACGLEHTVGVGTGGAIFAFGASRHGRLGYAEALSTPRQPRPRVLGIGTAAHARTSTASAVRIVMASCGDAHTLFLGGNGRVLACGHGLRGATGLGHPTDAPTPQLVPCLEGVLIQQVAAGSDFSLALGSQAEVWAFGSNAHGQLGLGHTVGPVLIPQRISRLAEHGVVAIAAGSCHCLALGRQGELFAWGRGHAFQLGLGTASTAGEHTPRLVHGMLVLDGPGGGAGNRDDDEHNHDDDHDAHDDDGGVLVGGAASAVPGARRLAWHESRDRLARHLEKLQAQIFSLRGESERAEGQLAALAAESDAAIRRRDELVEEKVAAELAASEAMSEAAEAQLVAAKWQSTAEAAQAAAGSIDSGAAAAELQRALSEAADAQVSRDLAAQERDSERGSPPPLLAAEADSARIEMEMGALTRRLWELAQQSEQGNGGEADHDEDVARKRAVAQVWPTVVETFERLGAGVEVLRARLSQESAARLAAEAKLREHGVELLQASTVTEA
jgi:alpha-tubulin suppressor-like RCC1 family protein